MQRILLTIAFIICAAAVSCAQTEKQPATGASVEQSVLQLTNDWLAAEEKHDRAALERIIADDFQGTGPGGNTITKRMIVPSDGARAGGIKMKAQDMQARVYGDAAVVTGRGLPTGAEAGEVRFTLVFVRRQAGWQMVAGHLSPVPPQP